MVPIHVMLSNFTLNHIVIMLRLILCCVASRGFLSKKVKSLMLKSKYLTKLSQQCQISARENSLQRNSPSMLVRISLMNLVVSLVVQTV